MKELNRRLTTLDASFLYTERPTQPMHVGGCTVYAGRVSRDELIQILRDRAHLLPRYRQKIVFPPFSLAHPTWEDDPDFDISRHVEEMTLPDPADDRVLSEVGGRAYAGMLDRGRPLWKLVLLHAPAEGRTAMVWKIHHAMVDGVSGVDLAMVMHSLRPDAEPPPPPAEAWQPAPLPDALSLMREAAQQQLNEAIQTWAGDIARLLRPAEMMERVRQTTQAITSAMPSLLRPAPRVPFNGTLSRERQFAWAEFSFAEIRYVRSVLGGTVNDVVLAVIAGGLGRYLRAHGRQTAGMELRAMCPVSMRREEERGALGNLVSIMFAPLYAGITDPVERLAAERAAMERLKSEDQAGSLYSLTQLADRIPPAWQALAGQWVAPNTVLNTVSTNVPGPQVPLYLAGHKLLAWYPLGPLASGIGLFNAILSYNQKLTIGATVDPKLMPDVWFYTECLRESFAELLAAAAASDASGQKPAAVSVAEPRRKKKAAAPGVQ